MNSAHRPTKNGEETDRIRLNLSFLSEISDIFISEESTQRIIETALRSIMGVVAASQGVLLTYVDDEAKLISSAIRGAKSEPVEISVTKGLRRCLVDAESPLAVASEDRPPPFNRFDSEIRSLGAQLWIPLIVRKKLLGVLSLGKKFLNESYSEEDLKLLWTAGHHFSVGLFNQLLIVESQESNFRLNRKVVELETLYDAGLTLGSSLQVEEVVEEILLFAVGVVDARGGFLFLKDESTGRAAPVHHIGLNEKQQKNLAGPSVRRVLVRMMRGQKTQHLGSKDLPLDVTYAVVAPVGDLGLLAVIDKESRQGIQPFNEEDAHLLELMGQQAGGALANALLYKNILEVKNVNQNILSSIGNGVISTDLKGHIQQVNPSIARIFADTRIPFGRSCARFFHQAGCKGISEAVSASLKDGESRAVSGERISETDITLNARIAALRNEASEVQGVVIALEDLSAEMRLRTMFKQYTSDQVVDLLLDQKAPPALGGEEREVTILFVDIEGSSQLLGRIGAEAMVSRINNCFSRLMEIIFRYNGTFDKYTGDGFMVVYGAPVAFPDDTERAVQTALAVRDEMEKFNRENDNPLGLCVGISRGKVVAGNIGSLRRMEYTVIGRSVNLASRLCDGAQAGQIWAGPNVFKELKSKYEFDHAGAHRFKGIDPMDVYEVVGPKGSRRSSTKPLGGTMAKKKKADQSVDLTVPMIPEMELTVTKTAEAVAQFMGLEQEKLEDIKMALIEACINAFEHSKSKSQQVSIHFTIEEDRLVIEIADKGQGFDPEQARREIKVRRERGEGQRGWGLKIMSELMDDIDIKSDDSGTVITMIKHR